MGRAAALPSRRSSSAVRRPDLHWKDDQRSGGQGQQADQILRDGKFTEFPDAVVTGAHDHGGHAVNRQDAPAPPGENDGAGRRRRVKPQADAGGDRQRGENIDGPGLGAGKRGQQAGHDAKAQDKKEGADMGAQQLRRGGADQAGQTSGSQDIRHADHAGAHQDDGRADGLPDLPEIHHAGDQERRRGQPGEGVPGVAGDALGKHPDDGGDEYGVRGIFLPSGESGGLRAGDTLAAVRGQDVMLRQQSVLEQAVQQESQGKEQVYRGEAYRGNIRGDPRAFQDRYHDAVLEGGIDRKQRMVRREAGGQDDLGGRQLPGAGDGGKQPNDHNVIRGGACTKKAASQHDDENQEHVSLEPAFFRHAQYGPLESRKKAGLLKGGDDDHELHQHDDGRIGESGKRGPYVRDSKDDQQQAGQQRRNAKGQLVPYDHNDHEDRDAEGDHHSRCHFALP